MSKFDILDEKVGEVLQDYNKKYIELREKKNLPEECPKTFYQYLRMNYELTNTLTGEKRYENDPYYEHFKPLTNEFLHELDCRVATYLLEYGQKYKGLYDVYDIYEDFPMSFYDYLKVYYKDAYMNPRESDAVYQQMFSSLGLYSKEIDPYYLFAKKIAEEYGLDRDFIEVGCGCYPALSKYLSDMRTELHIEKGSITAYDQNLVLTSLNGVKLMPKEFQISTPVKPGTLLIGKKPCYASDRLIKKAKLDNLEYFFSICSCFDRPYDFFDPTDSEVIKIGGIDMNSSKIRPWNRFLRLVAARNIPEDMGTYL